MLNDSAIDVSVNYLLYEQTDKKGNLTRWTWVTNLPLTKLSVEKVMRAGRARWKIENETFNPLKNQGYHFEHNYGHGSQQLATVLALLMFLAFMHISGQREHGFRSTGSCALLVQAQS